MFLSKRLHFLETSSTQMFTNLSQNYQKVNDVFSSTWDHHLRNVNV